MNDSGYIPHFSFPFTRASIHHSISNCIHKFRGVEGEGGAEESAVFAIS